MNKEQITIEYQEDTNNAFLNLEKNVRIWILENERSV